MNTSLKALGYFLLSLWSVFLVVLMILVGSWHVAYAAPQRPPSGSASSLTHLLSLDCPCSHAILLHLLERGALPGHKENIWLLAATPEMTHQLTVRGFVVFCKTAQDLEAVTDIHGLPWLLIYNRTGGLAYSGGYVAMQPRPGVAFQDVALAGAVENGEHPTPLPAYGCAVGQKIQALLDPLNLKYPARQPITSSQ